MTVTTLTLLILTAAPTGFTTTVERVALVKTGTPSVEVDSLGGRIHLRGVKVTTTHGELCPSVVAERSGLVLRCSSRRLWAEISEDRNGLYLDVRSLRGVFDDSLVLRAWPLSVINIPESCPGTSAGARAECALARGDLALAQAGYTEALNGADMNLAQLRLGDFAMRAGDTEKALVYYSKVTPAGPIGRMARARACDLTSACILEPELVDQKLTDAIPEPMRTELQLYTMRRQTAAGDVAGAIAHLVERLDEQPSLCVNAGSLCQQIARAALESDDDSIATVGLQAFVSHDVRAGPLRHELAVTAAETSARLGAPGYAAALLAAETRSVLADDLDAHLLRCARLFLAAGDMARASVILEYATDRLGTSGSAQWKAIRRTLGQAPSQPRAIEALDLTKLESQTDLTNELARAAAVRTQATISREEHTP